MELTVSDDGGLVFLGPGPLSRQYLHCASSVSLAELLTGPKPKLTWKMKLLLSYFLAKAVWQFYDSEWMRRGWSKEMIHFMFERRSETPKGIFVDEPFLSCKLVQDKVDDSHRTHIFPKILALGIMFLEIELGIDIKDRMSENLGSDGKPAGKNNADYIAALDIFDETKWKKRDTIDIFKSIIKACLIPEDFEPFLNNIQELRNAFKERIVDPLQNFYKVAWGSPDTPHIDSINTEIPGSPRVGVPEGGVGSVLPSSVPSATSGCHWQRNSLMSTR